MMVVKVEVWPGGDESRAKEIDRLYIWNVSRLAEVSDYRYTDEDPRGRQGDIPWAGWVRGHRRIEGAFALLHKALTDYFEGSR